jgi:hypothetical protein
MFGPLTGRIWIFTGKQGYPPAELQQIIVSWSGSVITKKTQVVEFVEKFIFFLTFWFSWFIMVAEVEGGKKE